MNDELKRLEEKALKKDSIMPINYKKEKEKANALQRIENMRGAVLAAIATQSQLKIKMENQIRKYQYQIDYNQAKVEDLQKKLLELENDWNLNYKRLPKL